MVLLVWLLIFTLVALLRRQLVAETASAENAIESAWKIHAALVDWTGKVDQKASFALAVESAVLAAIITLSSDARALASLTGVGVWFYRIGVVLLIFAVGYAMRAVTPQLRGSKLKDEWEDNFIFFGHLRRWSEPELTRALQEKDLLPMLSRQLIKMSDIAWKKHRYLQRSLLLAAGGTILLVMAGMEDKDMFGRLQTWLPAIA